MHELSLSRAVVDTVVEHAGGRRVAIVRLRVGDLRQVVPGTLRFYFGLSARETVCEGARLEQERVALRLGCPACAREWEPDTPRFRCPSCGGVADVLAGEELEVESIEVEEAAPCTGPR